MTFKMKTKKMKSINTYLKDIKNNFWFNFFGDLYVLSIFIDINKNIRRLYTYMLNWYNDLTIIKNYYNYGLFYINKLFTRN